MNKMVEVKNLRVRFGNLLAVSHASFEVEEGQFVALIGPSGCGKSTLLRVLAGIIPMMIPAGMEGRISVLGTSPQDLKAGSIDMVFQENCLLGWRDAKGNVSLGLEVLGNHSPKISPSDFLSNVGLSGFQDSLPHELSGGMRQRVALAASLATCPRLLLMDEPFANLDALTRRKMWQVVVGLRGQGLIGAALLVTHSLEEAVVLADKIIVMAGQPGQTVDEILVDIAWPRITKNGVLVPGCSGVIDTVAREIWEVNHEAMV